MPKDAWVTHFELYSFNSLLMLPCTMFVTVGAGVKIQCLHNFAVPYHKVGHSCNTVHNKCSVILTSTALIGPVLSILNFITELAGSVGKSLDVEDDAPCSCVYSGCATFIQPFYPQQQLAKRSVCELYPTGTACMCLDETA